MRVQNSREQYQAIAGSELLTGIELSEVLEFIDVWPMTCAVREYRARLTALRR